MQRLRAVGYHDNLPRSQPYGHEPFSPAPVIAVGILYQLAHQLPPRIPFYQGQLMEPPPADQTRQIIQVMTTVGSEQAASQLAEKLIEKKLAACIQIDAKIQSVYAWKGETCRDPEWRLVIKTLDSHWIAVREAISENHPYELPEILGQTMAWSTPEYRHWVIEQVQA